VKIAAAGDRALLVDLGDVSAAELHAAAESVRKLIDVRDAIVGHSSLYVIFDGTPDRDSVTQALGSGRRQLTAAHRELLFKVSFHPDYAPDLPRLLQRISRDDFLRRIRGVRLVVRYLGFRGGFGYLDGWPAEWAMPRRPTSRPVARGSFAVAGAVAGFYPLDTPGGWNILGRTDADLRLEPGDVISIEPTLETIVIPAPPAEPQLTIPGVEVSGPLARVMPVERAFDLEAAGMISDTLVIECAQVVPRISSGRPLVWVGPDAVPTVDIPKGRIEGGMRGYIAADDGGRSSRSEGRARRLRSTGVIHAVAGPHDIGLRDIECEVTPQLDRVGIRLKPAVKLDAPADLRSIGMQCGTVQLHPDGSLVVMGPDHPITGGYLQPMTVLSTERWKLAQLRPGERVRIVAQPPK
jgi:allophanate hydrolase subunit 1